MPENAIKMFFPINEPAVGSQPVVTESLWAEPLNSSPDCSLFRIKNSPFNVYEISFLDVVSGVAREDGAGYNFTYVVDRGGHSTYRIRIERPGSPDAF